MSNSLKFLIVRKECRWRILFLRDHLRRYLTLRTDGPGRKTCRIGPSQNHALLDALRECEAHTLTRSSSFKFFGVLSLNVASIFSYYFYPSVRPPP